MENIIDIDYIIRANKKAGLYFFSDNTMKSFKTKFESGVYDNKYFVISNKRLNAKREFKICVFNEQTGNVKYYNDNTANISPVYANSKQAINKIQSILEQQVLNTIQHENL